MATPSTNGGAFGARLETVLASITDVTRQGTVYHALNDDMSHTAGEPCAFCAFSLGHPATASLCRYACRRAAMLSFASGEASYQRCWAGLLYVTAALAPDGICRGGVSIGGFIHEDEEGDIRRTVTRQLQPMRNEERARFLSRLRDCRTITPAALRGMGLFMVETAISSGINAGAFIRRQNQKYRQQREIADAFEDLRREPLSPPDLLGDTSQLITFLHDRDRDDAMQFISRYLARVLMVSGWDLTNLKAHARVLLAVMTSREIVAGTDWAVATSRETQRLNRLMGCRTTEDCCLEIADVVLEHVDRADNPYQSGGSVSRRARRWMLAHYAEPVHLTRMAADIGASTSAIVHELKRTTGKTSRQLLSEIRVDAAKKLLATTAYEISAVADMCGFFDQSHFTRTFKAAVNLTPGRFRKLLRFTKDDI